MRETQFTERGRRRDQLFLEEEKFFIKELLLESRAEDIQGRQDGVGEINPGREKARINMESEQLHGIF